MRKIALIKCNQASADNPNVSPPLGLMYLASILRTAGHDVIIIDSRLKPYNDIKYILSKLVTFCPDVVGLSALTQEANNMHTIADMVKRKCKKSTVVAGGPHPDAFVGETLQDTNIDFVVRGEGEITFPELVSNIGKENYGAIKGIAYRKNGEIFFTEPRPLIEDLDALPFPAWDLIDIDEYPKYYRAPGTVARKSRYMLIFTSRGCPYRCIYCHSHKIFGRRFRARSPENVLQEIKTLIEKYDIRDFEIGDDIFNLDKERANLILDGIIAKKWKLRLAFANGLRCDLLDYELIKKMKQAGAYQLSVPVETASPRLQKFIRKNLDLEKLTRTIEWASKLKIVTCGNFMLGFPTETREEMLETINFAANSKCDLAQFAVVNPFKGTQLYSVCKARLREFNPSDYDFYQKSKFNLSAVDDKLFSALRRKAYAKFYFKPKRFLKLLFFFPNKKKFFLGAKIFLKRILPGKE